MEEWQLGRLRPDMEVCDVGGDKVGTIAHVYRRAPAAVGVTTGGDGPAPAGGVIEVKTGFLGLGPRLYIPLSAIHNALQDCVFLSGGKDELEGLGWYQKPPRLDELYER